MVWSVFGFALMSWKFPALMPPWHLVVAHALRSHPLWACTFSLNALMEMGSSLMMTWE